jgi:integrase
VQATLRALPEEARHRWAGIKGGREKPYFAAAATYTSVCASKKLRAWPASPRSLEAFARHLGSSLLPSSVESYLERVRTFGTACGLQYPPKRKLAGLKLVMRAQRRRAWRDVQRARPLRARHLRRLDRMLGRHWTAAGRRLSAMLWTSHTGLLRSVELLHLTWGDIRFYRHGIRIRILPEYSKMSQGGPGDLVWIPRGGSGAFNALLQWRRMCDDTDADTPVWGTEGVSYSTWLRQTKAVGAALKLKGVTTHSLRAGGATDLLQGGASFEAVQRAGRWTSFCFLIYNRPSPAEITAQLAAAFLASQVSSRGVPITTGPSQRQQRAQHRRLKRQRITFGDD